MGARVHLIDVLGVRGLLVLFYIVISFWEYDDYASQCIAPFGRIAQIRRTAYAPCVSALLYGGLRVGPRVAVSIDTRHASPRGDIVPL